MMRRLISCTALAALLIVPMQAAAQTRKAPPRTEYKAPKRESEYQRLVRERRENYRATERRRLWERQQRAEGRRTSWYLDDADWSDAPSMDSIGEDD